jgi:hypothetical protein
MIVVPVEQGEAYAAPAVKFKPPPLVKVLTEAPVLPLSSRTAWSGPP